MRCLHNQLSKTMTMIQIVSSRSLDRLRGIFCALIAVLLWATFGVVFKLTLSQVSSFSATFDIGLVATLALAINLLIKRKMKKVRTEFKQQPWFFLIAGILGAGVQQLCYLKGYQLLPASQVVILFYLYPLMLLLISAIGWKERLSGQSVVLLILAIAGMSWAISPNQSVQVLWNEGVIATLLAALSWALFSAWLKHKTFDADCGMFLFNLFGTLFLSGMLPAFGRPFSLTPLGWLGVLYLAIFPTAIAFLLWSQALRLSSTAICSSLALLTPVISLLLAIVVLHEAISPAQLLGFAVLLGCVFLNVFYSNRLNSELSQPC